MKYYNYSYKEDTSLIEKLKGKQDDGKDEYVIKMIREQIKQAMKTLVSFKLH